jgi:hypothetical protein
MNLINRCIKCTQSSVLPRYACTLGSWKTHVKSGLNGGYL